MRDALIDELDLARQARLRPRRLQRPARRTARQPTRRASRRRCRRSADAIAARRRASILASHLGRPKGKREPELSARARSPTRLAERARHDGDARARLRRRRGRAAGRARCGRGEVVLLENLRFHPEEEKNDPALRGAARAPRRRLRRTTPSAPRTARTPRPPAWCALRARARRRASCCRREVEVLSASSLQSPERPFVAILGGAKVSDKIGVIENLLDQGRRAADRRRHGVHVPARAGHADRRLARRGGQASTSRASVLARAEERGVALLLPVDHVVADRRPTAARRREVVGVDIPDGMMGVDIGPETIDALSRRRSPRARTVFWNGPMGIFEIDAVQRGHDGDRRRAGRQRRRVTVVGGGDSVAALARVRARPTTSRTSRPAAAPRSSSSRGATLPGVAALEAMTMTRRDAAPRRQLEDARHARRGDGAGRRLAEARRRASRDREVRRRPALHRARDRRARAIAGTRIGLAGAERPLGAEGRVHRRGLRRRC